MRLAICVSSIPLTPRSTSARVKDSHARLALAFMRRSGGKVDLDVDNRQAVVLDKQHARTRSRLPAFDFRSGVGELRQRQAQAETAA
jgi:hypothetical protein